MPATEAQVQANRANALKSTGPRTEAGKDASRANALTHGLTATKLIPEAEAAEVERRYLAFCEELRPSGEVGAALARQAAMMSVRTERCFAQENAALTERARRAEADFVPPEGVDEATAAKLRTEAGRRALFDDSKGATLARKYEAAAQRCFFRALKELRQLEKDKKAAEAEEIEEGLGSILPGEMTDAEFEEVYAKFLATNPPPLAERSPSANLEALMARNGVPIPIGMRR